MRYRFKGGEFHGTINAQRPLSYYSGCEFFTSTLLYDREQGAIQQHEKNQRIVTFMDATGLVPSKAWSSIFTPRIDIFCWDHTLIWLQRGSGYIVTTEPYRTSEDPCDLFLDPPKGWSMAYVPHFGMWNPPDTKLLIMAPPKRGGDVAAVVEALSKLSLKS